MRLSTLGRWLGVAALGVALSAPALAQRTVTLRMNSATMPDTVAAGPEAGVQVRGCLADCTDNISTLPGGQSIAWDSRTTLTPTNEGGDYWTIDFQIPDDQALNFKFYIDQSEGDGLPGGWEDGGDHQIAAGTDDVTLELHYFEKIAGDQDYDWRPFTAGGDSVAVWFRTYIDTEDAATKGLDLDDGDLVVAVRGDNATGGSQDGGSTTIDWGSNNVVLSRESDAVGSPGYALFSGRVAYPASAVGATQAYKFYFQDSDSMDGWEGDISDDDGGSGNNRVFTIPAQDSTLMWRFFSESPANAGTIVTSNVTFLVDVAPLSSIGLFQTSDDFAQVRGGFNGWGCDESGNNDDCLLQQIPGSSDFARQIPITSAPGGDPLNYKFYISLNNPDGSPFFQNDDGTENVDAGYEEPLDFGGGNRTFTFTGEDQTLDEQFFNADGQSIDVTFTVDMNNAVGFADAQGRAFNAAQDTVTVQFEDSFWLLTQGLSTSDETLISTGQGGFIPGFKLTDDDGDGVYMGTLTVEGPTYNGIGYRYAFANEADGIQVEGTGGFDAGRRRYRYVTDRTADSFSFALDTFRPAGPNNADTRRLTNMPWEVNPTGPFQPGDIQFSVRNGYVDSGNPVDVTDGPEPTGALALGAVYPNPAMGSARVAVSAASDALVTVRVFDVTGRVVATVTEAEAVAGRVLDIDTSDLASGLYLVRAEANGEVAAARFTVVR